MIKSEGYKAFHGDLEITPLIPNKPKFKIYNKDFIYVPQNKCWYGGGSSYPEEIVSGTFEYVSGHCHKCGEQFTLLDTNDTVDPCIYDIIETHENVTVEVLKCCNCGHIELSWHKEDFND